MSLPQPHLLQRMVSQANVPSSSQRDGLHVPGVTGISLSKKAEGQESQPPAARTSAPSCWGHSGQGSPRAAAT